MPKRYNIKWGSTEERQLDKAIADFNGKLLDIIRINPDVQNYLPEPVLARELKAKITTRNDLNRVINSLGRFQQNGAEIPVSNEKGLTVTKWEKTETQYQLNKVNAGRKNERERIKGLPMKSRGELTGSTYYEQKQVRMVDENLEGYKNKEMNFADKSADSWEHFKRLVDRQSFDSYSYEKRVQMKTNYLEALMNVFGDECEDVWQGVMSLPPDVFYDVYLTDSEAGFEWVYDSKERSEKLEKLRTVWTSHGTMQISPPNSIEIHRDSIEIEEE